MPITIEAGLSALRARWPELQSPNPSAPVFIFSAGWRSGSTFLQRWIMTDPHILVWGEPYGQAGLVSSLAGQLKAFTQTWPPTDFFGEHRDPDEDLLRAWVANLYPSIANFMSAHIGYFESLFLEPAVAVGKERWGMKEVRLDVEHASYLQWLFPNAKFLFLYRNPYHAYSSYRRWQDWYITWPDKPIFTADRFGRFWKELTADFVKNHHRVGGLLLRYEELPTHATKSRLENYLGVPLAEPWAVPRVVRAHPRAQAHPHWMPRLETLLLTRQVEPLSLELGYRPR